MNTTILAPIARDNHIRDAEASSFAHEIFLNADSAAIDDIVRYGKYLIVHLPPPEPVVRAFCIAVVPMDRYQEITAPLVDFPARREDFDHKFAITLCRLVSTGV